MPRVLSGIAFAAAFAGAVTAHAQVATKRFEHAEMRYTIDLPAPCRHMAGAGTLEAVCATDLDPAASETVATAGALLFEIDAEAAPTGAAPYTEAAFRTELPELVCGESDATKVGIADVTTGVEGPQVVHKARVICPPVRLLALPERQADVRVIVIEEFRYRLVARWPAEAATVAKPIAQAFFASFTSTAASK
jgi:hypothetical protein